MFLKLLWVDLQLKLTKLYYPNQIKAQICLSIHSMTVAAQISARFCSSIKRQILTEFISFIIVSNSYNNHHAFFSQKPYMFGFQRKLISLFDVLHYLADFPLKIFYLVLDVAKWSAALLSLSIANVITSLSHSALLRANWLFGLLLWINLIL